MNTNAFLNALRGTWFNGAYTSDDVGWLRATATALDKPDPIGADVVELRYVGGFHEVFYTDGRMVRTDDVARRVDALRVAVERAVLAADDEQLERLRGVLPVGMVP